MSEIEELNKMKNEDGGGEQIIKTESLKKLVTDPNIVKDEQRGIIINGEIQNNAEFCDVQQNKMMTLGSNNEIFLTTQDTSHGQAIFSSKELPQYLQKTLDESLSKVVISEEGKEKVIEFIAYRSEENLPDLTALITEDLSEPYSIYTYRYFLHNWPQLSFLVSLSNDIICNFICI